MPNYRHYRFVVAASAVSILVAVQPSFGILSTIKNLISQYMPILEEKLSGYLEPLIDDYSDVVADIVTGSFEQVVTTGNFNPRSALSGAIPDVAKILAEDENLPEGALNSIGYGILNRDKEQLLNGGFGLLQDKYRKDQEKRRRANDNPTTNPNGTNTGDGVSGPSGDLPPSNESSGTGKSGIPESPGVPQKQDDPSEPGPQGTTACQYATTCVGSFPEPFADIFAAAKGALGIIDPVAVRGGIYDQAAVGRVADGFATNSTMAGLYTANEVDRQLAISSTQAHFSKEAQDIRQKSNQARQELIQSKRDITKEGLNSDSSQEVLKALLSTSSITPELQSAQMSLMQQQIDDNQHLKIGISNISKTADMQRRARDTELNSAAFNNLFNSLTVYIPGTPEGTKKFPTR